MSGPGWLKRRSPPVILATQTQAHKTDGIFLTRSNCPYSSRIFLPTFSLLPLFSGRVCNSIKAGEATGHKVAVILRTQPRWTLLLYLPQRRVFFSASECAVSFFFFPESLGSVDTVRSGFELLQPGQRPNVVGQVRLQLLHIGGGGGQGHNCSPIERRKHSHNVWKR